MRIRHDRLSPAESGLIALLAAPPPERRADVLARVGEAALLEAAEANELAPHAGHLLADAVGWDALDPRWKAAHDATARRIAAFLAELDAVADRLHAAGIPVVALKNAGIARGIHRCPGCSPMGDLDVLVRRADFRRAHALLLDAGYAFEFRSPLEEEEIDAAERGGGAEYRKTLHTGEELWFELQWRAVGGRWIRPDQEPDGDALMARSVPIEGSRARLLAPEDNLLQVALHTAKHSWVRAPGFRLHLDVDRIVRGQTIDWDAFVARVRALRVRTPVHLSLAFPRALFGTPIPDRALDALAPGRLKPAVLAAWIQRAGLFGPGERKFGNAAFLLFTALLYDGTADRLRAVFPDPAWMRRRYGFRSGLLLPWYHVRRLADLAFRRTL